jgi:hypothetical protein
MEHLLLLSVAERIGESLPYAPQGRRKGGKLKEYIRTMNDVVLLPQIDLHKVVQPLLDLYDKVSKVRPFFKSALVFETI